MARLGSDHLWHLHCLNPPNSVVLRVSVLLLEIPRHTLLHHWLTADSESGSTALQSLLILTWEVTHALSTAAGQVLAWAMLRLWPDQCAGVGPPPLSTRAAPVQYEAGCLISLPSSSYSLQLYLIPERM